MNRIYEKKLRFNHLVLDIETIPDIDEITKIYSSVEDFPFDGNDSEKVNFALSKIYEGKENPLDRFLPLNYHKIITASIIMNRDGTVMLNRVPGDEKAIVNMIFNIINSDIENKMTLVTWNGRRFDIALLEQKAIKYGIVSKIYWDDGYFNRDAKWNNYRGRFHSLHMDLKDIISNYGAMIAPSLKEFSSMVGLPFDLNKISGEDIWSLYQQNKIEEIQIHCDFDVINTYIILLKHTLTTGKITEEQYNTEIDTLKKSLYMLKSEHLNLYAESI